MPLVVSKAENPPMAPPPPREFVVVMVDKTLSFIVHAQHASSRAMQGLGTLLYLRAGRSGITPKIARHLVIAKVLPRLFWPSPIWLTGAPSIASPLEIRYHRIARWITGLPPSTRITKLLTCAHLPPITLWLDLISTYYAIRLITLPNNHALRPLPVFNQLLSSSAGPHRVLSFVSEYLTDSLETRSHTNLIDLQLVTVHHHKPKTEKETQETLRTHMLWIQ